MSPTMRSTNASRTSYACCNPRCPLPFLLHLSLSSSLPRPAARSQLPVSVLGYVCFTNSLKMIWRFAICASSGVAVPRRCISATAGSVVATSRAPKSTDATRTSSPCSSPDVTDPLPTSEDYRALLLDLLLYRRETIEPLLTALRQERRELEVRMAELGVHMRELQAIRDELRGLAEEGVEEQQQKLHAAVVGTSAASPPSPASECPDEVVL